MRIGCYLEENLSTGYQWTLDGTGYTVLNDVHLAQDVYTDGELMVGGGGLRTFLLELDEGECLVTATYVRPFDLEHPARQIVLYSTFHPL